MQVLNNLFLPLTRNAEMMASERLRCGVTTFTQKSTHNGVTIHFRTWVPYLTLLPTPSPTREVFFGTKLSDHPVYMTGICKSCMAPMYEFFTRGRALKY